MVVFEKITTRVALVLAYLGGAAIVGLVLHILVDTTMRSLLKAPIEGTLIYSQYWYMIVLGFGAWAWGSWTNQHIDAPIFADRLSGPWPHVWEIFIQAVAVVVLAAMTWYSFLIARRSFALQEYQGAFIPIWPSRIFVPIACLSFLAISVLKLLAEIRRLRPPAASTEEPVISRSMNDVF